METKLSKAFEELLKTNDTVLIKDLKYHQPKQKS